ncbi:MAG TPA: hypothetical protein VGC58_00370 [Candidatus Paceibacterota bacterium]
MLKSELFKKTSYLLIFIAVLDILATVFYFHWTIWWYDVMLHILAGACVGMAFMLLGIYHLNFPNTKRTRIIFYSFFAVLTVGFLWEVFEIGIGATSLSAGDVYKIDTVSDFLADLSGGFFGTLYSFKFFKK